MSRASARMFARSKRPKESVPAKVAGDLELGVTHMCERLNHLLPPFPLSRIEVERIFAPPQVLTLLRQASAVDPTRFRPNQAVGMRRTIEFSGRPRTLSIYMLAPGYDPDDESTRQYGFLVPDEPLNGYEPPGDILERLDAYCLAHYRVRLQQGVIAAALKAVLEWLETPRQVAALWPGLFELGVHNSTRRLAASMVRARLKNVPLPDRWTPELDQLVRTGRGLLARATALSNGDARLDTSVICRCMRDVDVPLRVAGGYHITIS